MFARVIVTTTSKHSDRQLNPSGEGEGCWDACKGKDGVVMSNEKTVVKAGMCRGSYP